MKLISLEVNNFKKFDRLHKFDFEDTNIIIEPNGFGKTSTFQAILFALYGERPAGGSLNNFLNDPKKKASVKLVYSDNNEEYTISRIIGGTSSLYKGEECITTSTKEINQYAEMQYPKGVREALINYGSLGNISLKPSIIDELILDKKPQALLISYKRSIYDLRVINKKLTADYQEATNRLKALSEKVGVNNPTDLLEILNQTQGVSSDVINKVQELRLITAVAPKTKDPFGYIKAPNKLIINQDYDNHFAGIEKRLKTSQDVIDEQKDLPKRSVPVSLQLVKESNAQHICQACNHELTEEMHPSQDSASLKKAEESIIEFKWILEHKSAIIDAYLYFEALKELQQLEALYGEKLEIATNSKITSTEVSKGLLDFLSLTSLQEQLADNVTEGKKTALKQSITEQYITEQREILSDQIVGYATKVLSVQYASSGFLAVMVSDDGSGFSVYRGGDLSNIHPVSLLSSGERTIVNFALIIAISKIFPSLPVILDEPFGNLDSSNKPLSLRVAKEELHGHQLFLTNH